MTRSQKRKVAIIVVLLILLLLLAAYFVYYNSTKKLTFDIAPRDTASIEAPQYLYAFSGSGDQRLQRPIGVMVQDPDVFVVDSVRRKVDVFSESGEFRRSFGGTESVTPLYLAKHPKTGRIYVSDRRTRSVHIYAPDGKYLGEFDPKLPKAQLPAFDTQGVQWAPVAIAFAPDGTMYVTEILNGHRILIFDPSGKFTRSVGNVGAVTDSKQKPELFLFPNGLAFFENKLYVTDSNNRRVKVYAKNGDFERIVETEGLPRGISFLRPFRADEPNTPDRYVVIDTLAHDGTVWGTDDEKQVNFGEQGIQEGQFNYPNGVSVMTRNNKIFITDTANGRVQVWGWPEEASPVVLPRAPQRWYLCLLPLLLLPLLLLLRRTRFLVTTDFIEAMLDAEQVYLMPSRRRIWYVLDDVYERFRDVTQGDVALGELLRPTEFSESDARALQDKLEIEYEQAKVLSAAQRVRVFANEDVEMRRLAKVLEIDVVNRVEFIERFEKKTAEQARSGQDGPAE